MQRSPGRHLPIRHVLMAMCGLALASSAGLAGDAEETDAARAFPKAVPARVTVATLGKPVLVSRADVESPLGRVRSFQLDASSNTGEKKRHGAHHGAQKSTITMGLSLTVLSKLSFVRLTVVINRFLSGYRAKAMYKNKSSSLLVESRAGAGTDSRSRSRMVEILQW